MALFGSSSSRHGNHERSYREVAEDEDRPLREEKDSEDNDYRSAEIYDLTRSLRKTNLILRVIAGLFGTTIVLLLLLVFAAGYKTKQVKAAGRQEHHLKTPVPDRKWRTEMVAITLAERSTQSLLPE